MKKYLIKKIISISETELLYYDSDGNERKINFEECRKNFYKHWQGDSYTIEDDDRCVAERNSIATPPYIEFYSNPPSRIEFGGIAIFKSSYKKMAKIRDLIESVGWKTFDLS
jgi:hypothetical protein